MARGKRMTYAEKVQYNGTAAAQEMLKKEHDKIDAKITEHKVEIATWEVETVARQTAFNAAIADLANVKPVFPVETTVVPVVVPPVVEIVSQTTA